MEGKVGLIEEGVADGFRVDKMVGLKEDGSADGFWVEGKVGEAEVEKEGFLVGFAGLPAGLVAEGEVEGVGSGNRKRRCDRKILLYALPQVAITVTVPELGNVNGAGLDVDTP